MVGGGDGGMVREVLKHKCVESVHLCEIDEVGRASRLAFDLQHLCCISAASGRSEQEVSSSPDLWAIRPEAPDSLSGWDGVHRRTSQRV